MKTFMIVVRALPVILSLLVLGAHFLRAELVVLAAACVVLPALLLVPQRWSARLMQLALALGALEWLRTLSQLVQVRTLTGEPWTRMAIILASVTLFTALSALVFQGDVMGRRYGLRSGK